MQPRDHAEGARVVFILTAVAAGVAMASDLAAPDVAGRAVEVALSALVLPLIVAGSCALRYGSGSQRTLWALFPFAGLFAVLALDLLTGDASAGAQTFLLFPALYAGSQLDRHGALAVTAAAVATEAVIVFCLLPARPALIDLAFVAATIATTSMLLVRTAEQRETVLAQLRHLAAVDPLTGLVTRRVLETAAQSALSGAAGRSGTALLVLDIDRFKSVNDRYGHQAGDEVLIQLAGILLNLSRPEDTVSRMGGDEIALLLPSCSAQVALLRAETIRFTTAAHVFVLPQGEQIRLSVSVGVAHAPTQAAHLRSLYAAADASLYDAKRDGRDRVGSERQMAG